MITPKISLVSIMLAMLAACGGGEDGNSSQAASFFASEGIYVGRLPQPVPLSVPVYRSYQITLENNEIWFIDDFTANGEPTYFATGSFESVERTTGTKITTRFRSTNSVISVNSSILGASPVSITETIQPLDQLISATLTEPMASRNHILDATPASSVSDTVRTTYAYSSPAEVTRLAGTWIPYQRFNATLSFDSAGRLSGKNERTGCVYVGTVVPRSGGKNAFNSSIQLTGCADALTNGSYTGIAFQFVGFSNTQDGAFAIPMVILMTINSSRNRVFALHAEMQRPGT